MNGAARRRSTARWWTRGTLALLWSIGASCTDHGRATGPGDAKVRVVIAARGGDLDENGYDILVDTLPKVALGRAVDRTFTVSVGTHTIAIGDVAENCQVTGLNPRAVTMGSGESVTVQFVVICAPVGVMIATRTSGDDVPHAFYTVVDALPGVIVLANDSVPVTRLPAGDHTVTVSAPTHCTVTPSRTTTVRVAVTGLTEALFEISCTPVPRLEKIAYVDGSPDAERRWIALVNLDGSGAEKRREGSSPAWSPDGKRLAFSDTRCDWSDDRYGYPPFCTGGLVLLDPELGEVAEPSWARTVESPSWSPTGDPIAVAVPIPNNRRELAIVQLAAPALMPLPAVGPAVASQPAWSPDGSRLAFVCEWPLGVPDICIANRDGTGVVRLTMDDFRNLRPAWSPDGTKIAFARYPINATDLADADLVVMDLGTGQPTTLTKGGDPAWSPDGSKLVFAGGDGLFIIDTDGTNRKRLTTGAHYEPAWRP